MTLSYRLILADVRAAMPTLADSSIDAIVTDPPYELGFMGRAWDSSGIAYDVDVWREALRVLKPGGHLIAFGGTRIYHRLACAVEDAGFQVRDMLAWLYGSGFPKSLDLSKAADRAQGAEPRVIGERKKLQSYGKGELFGGMPDKNGVQLLTEPATAAAAAALQGWGTALKPAFEPCVLARKPFRGTIAENVMRHGTGGLNIDACRIEISDGDNSGHWSADSAAGQKRERPSTDYAVTGGERNALGRWPANVLLDEEAAAMLDEQSGERPAGAAGVRHGVNGVAYSGGWNAYDEPWGTYGDAGGASRFFYTAKASRSEREEGLSDHREQRANHHPTVKPCDLMQWLVRLVTPRGGTVLDMFMGSGTTGMAAIAESFDFVGIEQDAEYIEIARRRIASVAPLLAREIA